MGCTADSVLDTPRPLASLPADLSHTCPACGHEMAVMVADLPKGRLTQCASCGELDYRRKAVQMVSVLPGQA
jgi:transcription elongation factor Elf1